MKELVNKLLAQLQKDLSLVDTKHTPFNGHDQRLSLVIKAIDSLKSYLNKHPLKNTAETVHYFKSVAPLFYWQHIYYVKLYNFELTRISSSKQSISTYIDAELLGIAACFEKYQEFWRYFQMNSSYHDDRWFIPGVPEDWVLDDASIIMDPGISLPSHRLSSLKANEAYRSFLEEEAIKIKNPPSTVNNNKPERTYTWEANETDLVELFYGLQRLGAIKVNGNPMSIDDYVTMSGDFFNKTIANIYDVHNHNSNRKIDETKFMNQLIKAIKKTQ